MKRNNLIFQGILTIGIAAFVLLTFTSCQSQGQTYGAAIDEKKGQVVTMKEIFSDISKYDGKNVIIKGTTGAICQTSGCWLMLIDGEHQLFVQFYDFTVRPRIGTPIRAQGTLKTQNKVPFLAAAGLEIIN